jgi:hypothetical protein
VRSVAERARECVDQKEKVFVNVCVWYGRALPTTQTRLTTNTPLLRTRHGNKQTLRNSLSHIRNKHMLITSQTLHNSTLNKLSLTALQSDQKRASEMWDEVKSKSHVTSPQTQHLRCVYATSPLHRSKPTM